MAPFRWSGRSSERWPIVRMVHGARWTDQALLSSFSDTTSLQSWITDYREENGRTYHAFRDGAYFQPNDELAQETLGMAFLRSDNMRTSTDGMRRSITPSLFKNFR
jgi:hypothetical protein